MQPATASILASESAASRMSSTRSTSRILRPPQNPRYASLDLWRGIACVFVVIYHSTSVYSGANRGDATHPLGGVATGLLHLTRLLSVGVPMFFVISGYCISATADSTRIKNRSVAEYFSRRFRRIFPPFWCAIVVQLLLVFALDYLIFPGLLSKGVKPIERPWELSKWQWLGNLSLTETWRWHLGGHQKFILGQSWTLCYEEQFYAVTGLILLLAPRRLLAGVVAVSCAVLITTHGAGRLGFSVDGLFLDGSWHMFAAGILVYVMVNYGGRRKLIAGLGILGLFWAYAILTHSSDLVIAAAFASLILVVHKWDRQTMALRLTRPLQLCGLMCYSLYLVHGPIVRGISQYCYWKGLTSPWQTLLLTVPICTGSALVAGWIFYLTVERRFLNRPTTSASPADSDSKRDQCAQVVSV